MITILCLESPEIFQFKIFLIIERWRHITNKVKILILQSDQKFMLMMQFSNTLVVAVHLFQKLMLLKCLQIILVPKPYIPKLIGHKKVVFIHKLIDDINSLTLLSILEVLFKLFLVRFQIYKVKFNLHHLAHLISHLDNEFIKLWWNFTLFCVKYQFVFLILKQTLQIFF